MRPRTAKVELDSYPRPPRGGRPAGHRRPTPHREFLSTPSVRRATRHGHSVQNQRLISIHALREEGDGGVGALLISPRAFLSTPSARRATMQLADAVMPAIFLPTPSARRATCGCGDPRHPVKTFLSTPSARRATITGRMPGQEEQKYFYPRPPRGGRPERVKNMTYGYCNFYPRPPRGGRQVFPFRCA